MPVSVGINGLGRIGRQVLRATRGDSVARVVGANDIADARTLTHLIRYDSVHGRFQGKVDQGEPDDKGRPSLVIDGAPVRLLQEPDPGKLPWRELGADVVLECTGRVNDRAGASKHLESGARKVIVSAPIKDADITLCCGINLEAYDPGRHTVLSNASCTTNCLAPIAKVLHQKFGIRRGLMTTVHSYTNDQRILDLPHKDLRRARAAAVSMIPTTTGAAKAVTKVLPELEGRLDGMSIRVPTPNVSVVDFTAELDKTVTREAVNEALKQAASGSLAGILDYTEEELVSIDFNGDLHSAIVDGLSTMTLGGQMVKVIAWYDNESGYARRLWDLTRFVAEKGL
jgi:glyceraldehyde 3-phosphate dehydrogenase